VTLAAYGQVRRSVGPVAIERNQLERAALVLMQTEGDLHRELGRDAAAAGLAALAAFGPRARLARDAAIEAGLAPPDAFHTEDPQALAAFLRERLRPGDVLLVKGSRGMKLERLVEALH